MDRKLANNLLAGTMWSMYDTVESTVQFCLQKPNVHNRTLSKNTYEASLTYRSMVFTLSMGQILAQSNRILAKQGQIITS